MPGEPGGLVHEKVTELSTMMILTFILSLLRAESCTKIFTYSASFVHHTVDKKMLPAVSVNSECCRPSSHQPLNCPWTVGAS